MVSPPPAEPLLGETELTEGAVGEKAELMLLVPLIEFTVTVIVVPVLAAKLHSKVVRAALIASGVHSAPSFIDTALELGVGWNPQPVTVTTIAILELAEIGFVVVRLTGILK